MCSVCNFVLQIIVLCIITKTCCGNIYANNTSHTRTIRQSGGCVLPEYPEYGYWTIYQQTSELFPGQTAPLGTILQISCKEHRKLNGDATMVCVDGKWTTKIGQCLRTCPARHSTSIMTVTCTHNERILETCDEPVDKTSARFQCADFYEAQSLERHPVHVCYNGRWSHSLPECVPICGQKSTQSSPLIVGGGVAKRGDYPWQVALYNTTDKNLQCGGSLLNQKVILTAAHCITDDNGKLLPIDTYTIAVGKYFRNFYDSRDINEAQFSEVYEMHVPKQYKGDIQNYFGDVGLIITKKTFTLSIRVQPICVDWGYKYDQALLDPTRVTHGYVTGWGFTVEHKSPSDVLKELRVPLITEEECMKKLPEDYEKFLTDDKLCAGFIDKGQSVCRGDSGGCLAVKYGSRYYAVGVVSLSPQAPTEVGGCDSKQYALYTRISYYVRNFILEKEAQYKPLTTEVIDCDDPSCKTAVTISPPTTTSTTTTVRPSTATTPMDNKCVLPEHPKSGQWSIFGSTKQFTPSMKVSQGTILQISCAAGYKLDGSEKVLCEKGKWVSEIGQCLRACSPIRSTTTTEITCSFKGTEMKDCSSPLDGTIAKHSCAPFYEDLQLDKNPIRVCRNGSWDLTIPECVPICGQKSVSAQTLIVNGRTPKRTDYPWHAGVYRGSKKEFICGGTLISQKLVITGAHCVTDRYGKTRRKQDFTVGVGKFHREYYNPLDNKAQFSEVGDIFVPLAFAGIRNNYLGDIAVLVAKNSFTLSEVVQPVCVDWALKYLSSDKLTNLTGYVTGWGHTSPGSSLTDELQELQVPTVSNQVCLPSLPDDFNALLGHDKLCAGYVDKNTSVCTGDAGGSLVTKHEGRYYITGIISIAPALPQGGGCDVQKYALYTKVSSYIDFILEKEAQTKTSNTSEVDCNSNENPNACEISTVVKPLSEPGVQGVSCTLPEHPNLGRWSIFGASSSSFTPGTSVNAGTIMQITCNTSYKLEGDSIILCENGKWSSSIGQCTKICPSVRSSATTKAICIIDGKETVNCTEPIDGTQVKYECAPFYEDLTLSQNPVHVCKDGTWSHKPPTCVPICGQKSTSAQLLIINGETVKKGDYPWHAAIYSGDDKRFICSGALISSRIILTVAQCVTTFEGKVQPKSRYTVAVGKYYRKYTEARENDKYVQTAELEEVIIHPHYRGFSGSAIGNIALLIAAKPFTFSQRVQPVCVDWGLKYISDIDKSNTNLTGYVTGWGYTVENDKPSDELQELEVPIIKNQKCYEELPPEFITYLSYDKFCAGYRNKGKAICRGDSGGPLVVKFAGRFYITGLAQSSPLSATGGCDIQQYALYAKISTYLENFILPKSIQYQ